MGRLLCLGGFRRLSGMIFSTGGGPATRRARRRASVAAEKRLRRLGMAVKPGRAWRAAL